MTEQVDKAYDELAMLKQQADAMGIKYKSNVSIKVLKKMVAEALSAELAEDLTSQLTQHRDENLKLIRVIVAPMDVNKRDWFGDYFTVSNSVLPTVKRFIPYNVEWHIENILYKNLVSRQHQVFISKKDKGQEYVESKLMPMFNIQVLPPLTKEEISRLAKSQDTRDGVGSLPQPQPPQGSFEPDTVEEIDS